MDRLEELYTKMVDEAPRFFPESNKPYILELAREYATEVARHNLERAANQAQMSYRDGHHKTNSRIKYFQSGADHLVVDMESITSIEIELI